MKPRSAAVRGDGEDWEAISAQIEHCEWDVVVKASRELQPEEYERKRTFEAAVVLFLAELLRQSGCDPVASWVKLPGSSDPANRRTGNLEADVIAVREAQGQRHFLVVEAKWGDVGGSEAAAQAYEYACRIKRPGERAEGLSFMGYRAEDVQRDFVHPVVVANVVPERSDVAEVLTVRRMSHLDFAKLIALRGDLQLPTV